MADTTWLVQDALARGEQVLLEGAQGTLLDIDHGSYPYVTSSSPVAGGACTGGGIGPLQVDEVIGVMKAYSTRVGSGPYPTELTDEIGRGIATRGREVGTTTGRPRRVGWFDAVSLRYAVAVNSVSSIMLNKLDILSGIDEICLCVAYEVDGERVDSWPSSADVLARATPIYERFPGWREEIHDVRALGDLPENARRYVSRLEELAGVPIVLISVGPERTQTIERAARPYRRGVARPPDHDRGAPGVTPPIMPTRILIVGSGGREHALAWKLAHEPGVNDVIVAPGSDGIATEPRVTVAAGRRPARREGRDRRGADARGRAGRGRARGAAGRRGRRRCRRAGNPGVRALARRRSDRIEQGVLSRGRRGRRRADGARAAPSRRPIRRQGSRSRWGSRATVASSSRPMAWRPARASRSATRSTRPPRRISAQPAAFVIEERLSGPRGERHRALRWRAGRGVAAGARPQAPARR